MSTPTSIDTDQKYIEITLGDERYAFDVSYTEEIVERETITRMPNTPDCVKGLIDLRGRVTTVLDPTDVLDIDNEGTDTKLIIIFDTEQFNDQQGNIGWIVDDVQRVSEINSEHAIDPPEQQTWMDAVVSDPDSADDEYTIIISPELVVSRVEEAIEESQVGQTPK